ncbi:hypothetical protein PTKIN_Ptkin06aG0070200 [Pterospermum kingtungense]
MDNQTRTASVAASSSNSSAFSSISKGWREVRNSADADLQLMKDRANSFKNLAASFDREIESLLHSAPPNFAVPVIRKSSEIDFMKKLKPKISEFRREVPPLDVPELLACFLRQSGPFLDQLGVRRDLCDKIVESLCSKRKNQLVLCSLAAGEPPAVDPDKINDELDLRIASVLQNLIKKLFIPTNSLSVHQKSRRIIYVTGLKKGLVLRLILKSPFILERRSIIPAGDTSQFIPSKDADIAILEEPEHLNWYHHGKCWTDKFNHVVGIVHTNYLEYIKREKNGALQAFLVKHINNWVTKAYCHKVLRLSAATQDLPKSVICNVHGVNPRFLKIGEKVAEERELGLQTFPKEDFLGKMVWAKGYKELVDLLAKHKNDLDGFKLDVYGNGEDAHEVQSTAKRLDLNLNFLTGRDHADESLHGYKIFVNPICTATAEALAMGKFVVCADHPSNEFFRSFPNCLTYKTSEDFVAKVKQALANEPQPLTPEQRFNLSWEAATQRFIEYSELGRFLNNEHDGAKLRKSSGNIVAKSFSVPSLSEMVDRGLAFAHFCLTGNEFLRLCTGAIPGTRNYDKQHCKDLHLLPPQVENPIYGW